jgi:hypothetical protein
MSRPKRGKDHNWELIKYNGDRAVYARCKCKFEYSIFLYRNGTKDFKVDENGQLMIARKPDTMYLYCPRCGAKKKTYNALIRRLPGLFD